MYRILGYYHQNLGLNLKEKQATFVLTYFFINLHTQKNLPRVLFWFCPTILSLIFMLIFVVIYNVRSVYRMFFVYFVLFVNT